MQEITENQARQTIRIYRYGYAIFLVLVVYLLIRGDVENATINLGIALIFDPFDSRIQWQNRPLWQRVWLLLHVALTFTGFIYLIVN